MRCGKAMCLGHCKDSGGCPFHGIVDNESKIIDLDADDSESHSEDHCSSGPESSQLVPKILPSPKLPPLRPPALQSRASSQSAPFQAADASKTRPCITRQLDPLWMEDLSKLAAQEVENQKADERRREMMRNTQHHFIVHWYDAVSTTPLPAAPSTNTSAG